VTRAIAILVLAVGAAAASGGTFDPATREFLQAVDVEPLKRLAVEYNGRIAVLDTVAREQLAQMAGTSQVDDVEPTAAYLELHFNTGRYLDQPLLEVRARGMRRALAGYLTGRHLAALQRTGRIAPGPLVDEAAATYLLATGRAEQEEIVRGTRTSGLGTFLARLMQHPQNRLLVDRLAARYEAFLAVDVLRVIPSATGPWDAIDAALDRRADAAETDPRVRQAVRDMRDAWRARDVRAVDAASHALVRDLPTAAADYPAPAIREIELLYNRAYKGTVLWIGYAVALAGLIIAAATGARWARRTGLAVFTASTVLFAVGFVVRWIISGREWYLPPLMDQWEAVTGSALLGAVLALGLECRWRRNYVALAAALYATLALLAAHFVPILLPGKMDAELKALPGLLSSKVMAVHVSVIIVGHALVGMTLFISLIYLAKAALNRGVDSASADLAGPEPAGTLAAIDRCNLLVAQLACWTVLAGTILGAYWADIAWGRWWGWDHKETWALMTALVYLGALHIRFVTPAAHRGLVTAVICILGFCVMIFNWIVVNFFLTGLHSYA